MIGRPIIRLDSVSSTQDILFRLAERGAREGTTVVARHQTGGRGRAGRSWSTPPGEALLFSVLFRPELPPDRLSPLSVLVADAIAMTVQSSFAIQPTIKWPNDVLVRGRKLSGVLIQVRGGIAVAGIGLNVLSRPDGLPHGATSIHAETGRDIDLDVLLHELLHAIGDRYRSVQRNDIGPAIQRVNDRLHLRGEEVTLQDGERIIRGRVAGVRDDGALLLDVDGETRAVVSGELVRGPRPAKPTSGVHFPEPRYTSHEAINRPVGPSESDT